MQYRPIDPRFTYIEICLYFYSESAWQVAHNQIVEPIFVVVIHSNVNHISHAKHKFPCMFRQQPQLKVILRYRRCFPTLTKFAPYWGPYLHPSLPLWSRTNPTLCSSQGQGNLLCLCNEKAKEKPSGLNGFRGGSPARLILLLAIKLKRQILYVA